MISRKQVLQKQVSRVNDSGGNYPDPGSEEEFRRFQQIQRAFEEQFELFFPDNLAPKTVVVIPSLTLDQEVLAKIDGAMHYEERMLCLLMLLRMPRTHVVYVTSMPIDPIIIDYYLHLLPGITGCHARERLTLLNCQDMSAVSLTEKILKRERLIERIRRCIHPDQAAHMACFNTTPRERTLSVRLGIPIYGCDPSLLYLGTKSGSRKIFLHAGIPMPPGVEDIRSYDEIVHAVSALKDMYPDLKKAVIKINEGFSGEGNALFTYPGQLHGRELFDWIQHNLYRAIVPVAKGMEINTFLEKFAFMGGTVEAFIEGEVKFSPSVQCRINPLGETEIISTHDQLLGGESGQVFLGAHFPCDTAYRADLSAMARLIADALKSKGALGRFAIDFISVKEKDSWKHYAIEINMRKGGTTHPYLMLQFLTDGNYNQATGRFETQNRQERYYFASDNLQNNAYRGLSPQDLIDIAIYHGLHFDGATQKGVVFHMIGALSQFGKMGIVCIGESREEAFSFYNRAIKVLDEETC